MQHQATILEAFYKDNPIGIAQAERLEPMHPDGNGFGERFGECLHLPGRELLIVDALQEDGILQLG